MKTKILIIALVISGTLIMFSMPDVSACLCDELTIEQRINQADVIFSGTVNDNTWDHWDKNIAAGFDVQTVWKGQILYL